MTAWDRSPPQKDERAVGTFDVIPTDNGVQASNVGRLTTPDSVKAQLRAEAQRTGETATQTTRLRYTHDLDTHETDARAPRRSYASLATKLAKNGAAQPAGALSPRMQKAYEKMTRSLQRGKSDRATRRRARGSATREKERAYKMPEIVIIQDAAPLSRGGF